MLDAVDRLPGGPKVNATSGHHVHFDGSANLSLEDVKRIAASYYVHEEAFDIMMPRSRQGNGNRFLRSHRSGITPVGNEAGVIQRIRGARDFDALNEIFCPDGNGGVTRYYKLNLTNLSTRYVPTGRQAIKTIEFRQHSATWEAGKSVMWIRLLEHFVEKTRGKSFVSPMPPGSSPAQKLTHLFNAIDLPQELRQFWSSRATQLNADRMGARPGSAAMATVTRSDGYAITLRTSPTSSTDSSAFVSDGTKVRNGERVTVVQPNANDFTKVRASNGTEGYVKS
eukprot:3774512-Prymnesium_polylepis.1